ncbi:uncharacterized protein LY79DRAFT_42817 [Colletotrichum navitas]|uniref:Uncharacterized protein n=1 Tax=Colletotrichum navitas TaxID=681940 RepID=A0AAD8PMC3_9PEZI|nr:uncharacterized protein LY79DRAFT_42817 [Colletotrichum navitas]KAK1572755.1 hypothetical protein LY79DRAFT_42817 [Colletotrichum navitas]
MQSLEDRAPALVFFFSSSFLGHLLASIVLSSLAFFCIKHIGELGSRVLLFFFFFFLLASPQ